MNETRLIPTDVEYIKPLDENGQPVDEEDPTYEVTIACPICGDPGDHCQDLHHWMCNHCEGFLEDVDGHWECSECGV